MIDVTQEKLEDAIRQYSSMNPVLDNVSLKPFWIEWELENFYVWLEENVMGINTSIQIGDMHLYPIKVNRVEMHATRHVFAVHAVHEDDEGAYRFVGSVVEFRIGVVRKRANEDWLKITPQYCIPQALDYLNTLIAKLQETIDTPFKYLDTMDIEEQATPAPLTIEQKMELMFDRLKQRVPIADWDDRSIGSSAQKKSNWGANDLIDEDRLIIGEYFNVLSNRGWKHADILRQFDIDSTLEIGRSYLYSCLRDYRATIGVKSSRVKQ